MYAIKYTRITGESGVFSQRFRTENNATQAASKMRCLDVMKKRQNEYTYEVIKI